MKRREFLRHSAAAAGLALSSPLSWLPRAFALSGRESRLSWHAYQPTSVEGPWELGLVEGRIPLDLDGSLYRIGPGAKTNYGVELKHLFDGDAHLTAFDFAAGRVSARSAFVDTAERQAERAEGKMLYHEFGTACPGWPKGFKNSPNVSVLELDNRVLAFSDGGAPVALNKNTLVTKGTYRFNESLPKNMTLTAHPKIDPVTGELFTFGFTQALNPEVVTFRHDRSTGTLSRVASFSIDQFYLIHDMMITENYLIFVIPPVYINFWGAAASWGPIADLLKFDSSKALEIVMVRKDGTGAPLRLSSSPTGTVFHHCNAFEDRRSGNVIFDTILCPNDKNFDLVKAWSADQLPPVPPTYITRFEINPKAGRILSRRAISDGRAGDFPSIDPRRLGKPHRFTYLLESERNSSDPLATNTLVCWDVKREVPHRLQASPTQMFGEALFIPRGGEPSEWNGYIVHLGFDGSCNQSFIDIRHAVHLGLEARVWMNRPLPLGFHGSWVPV